MKAASPAKPQPRSKTAPSKSAKPARQVGNAGLAPVRLRTAVLAGGYRVFDTPIEPKHTTRERIAEVVAAYVK